MHYSAGVMEGTMKKTWFAMLLATALWAATTTAHAQKSAEDCEAELGPLPASVREKRMVECLVGAATPARPEPPMPKPRPFKSNPADARAVMAAGKATLLRNLKDPDTAKLRSLKVGKDRFLCGEVNARNGFGGYVGYRRFVVLASQVYFDDDSGDFDMLVLSSCENYDAKELAAYRERMKNR